MRLRIGGYPEGGMVNILLSFILIALETDFPFIVSKFWIVDFRFRI